jgi:DNA-binding transcriptional regulator LsrR (DeoR family)
MPRPWDMKPDTEKIEKVMRMYYSGNYTVTSIARMFKISKQRVSQLIKKGQESSEHRCSKCGDPVIGEEGFCSKCI